MENSVEIFKNNNSNIETLVRLENNQLVVSSRDIAEHFEKEHKNLLRDIRGMLKNEHTKNMFYESTYVNKQNGQEYKEYLMNRDGFSLLVMGFTGAKALDWKLKYIEAFNQMEKELTMPRDYLSALKALVASEEEKQRLLAENKQMKPKAEYFDCLVDRNLLTNFRTTAKELGVKQNRFINWLLENNYVYRDNHNKLMPYAQYEEYFCVKDSKSSNSKWAGTQTLITPKGKEAFRLLLGVTSHEE